MTLTSKQTNKRRRSNKQQNSKSTVHVPTNYTSSSDRASFFSKMDYSEVFPDIEPIPQNDGPHPVCAIDYPEQYTKAMDYLRALMDKDEHSGAFRVTFICNGVTVHFVYFPFLIFCWSVDLCFKNVHWN